MTDRIVTFGGKNLFGVESTESLKFRGSGKEVVAPITPTQAEWCPSPASPGAGPEWQGQLLSGCGATAFRETESLNRVSSSCDEGWYEPTSHEWGEREEAGLS